MKENDHIRDFLDYYCSLSKAPGYAVLLSGSWGSGKTWFIKDFIAKRPKIASHALYVSLYGMQSFDDIESEFFRLLHPVLASKPVRMLNRLVRGVLKTTINFDIDGDGKSDGSVSAGVPNEKILEGLSLASEKIIIFDDLERSSIATNDILGYINQFIEQSGLKAIIIANEKELNRESGSNPSYEKIKEKTIGRSFEVLPELTSALAIFSEELVDTPAETVISDNLSLIAQIYECSTYRNLRILRHTLWDFARLLQSLQPAALDVKPLARDLLAIFMVYSFEVRTYTVTPEQLQKLVPDIFSHLFSSQQEPHPDKPFHDVYRKYSGLNLYSDLVSTSTWEKYFSTGSVPPEINESVLKSKYFQNSQQPSWVRLWHGMGLSDEEFEKVISEVKNDWDKKIFKTTGEISHAVGLFIKFSKNGLYEKSVADIISEGKHYIDSHWSAEYLSPLGPDKRSNNSGSSEYAGLGFASRDDSDFVDFLKYVEESRSRAVETDLPRQAAELLQLLTIDVRLFCQKIILSNSPENIYFKTPILHLIPPENFVRNLMSCSGDARSQVAYALKERYAYDTFNPSLLLEREWLSRTRELLTKEMEERAGKISSLNIKLLLPLIDESISKLSSNAET